MRPALMAVLVSACAAEAPPGTDAQEQLEMFTGPPIECSDPVSGMDRFREEGEQRGLTVVVADPLDVEGRHSNGRGGNVIAQDLDLDGDIDLMIGGMYDDVWVYLNDGNGNFSALDPAFETGFGTPTNITSVGATDIDGDQLPDAIVVTGGLIPVYSNQGGSFGAGVPIFEEDPNDGQVYLSMTWGDANGDGWLDLVLPGTGPSGVDNESGDETVGPERLLLGDGEGFTHVMDLFASGTGSRTMVAGFTDRDGDGDMDLLVPGDNGPPTAFWRNDGVDASDWPVWVDDAPAIGADLSMAAMGFDSADLNADGDLDYCITDVGPPRCLLSDGTGGYAEGAASIGLIPLHPADGVATLGWSLDFIDLDNDGRLDAVQSSGPDSEYHSRGYTAFPDLIWQGTGWGSFEDVTADVDFGDTGMNYGLATADFDGNGFWDVVLVGPGRTPLLYMNQCGTGGWIDIELVGQAGNSEAIGARLEAKLWNRTEVREMYGLRAQGQSPSRFHLGLGDSDTVEELTITWPTGDVTTLHDIPANRRITLLHPTELDR